MATRYVDKVGNLNLLQNKPDAAGLAVYQDQLFLRSANGNVAVSPPAFYGTSYFVDAVNGSDSNSGLSWGDAFVTISKAFTTIATGDRIFLAGRFREQLTAPAQVFDVGIYGVSHNTRHPDSTPANGNLVPARWDVPATATASTPLLIIQQQGWHVENILFTGSSTDTVDCIQLLRNSDSGNSERDASHTTITKCRFQGGRYGIVDSGGCARIRIIDNEFLLFSSSGDRAITYVIGAGVGTRWGWKIIGNDFTGNLSDIVLASAGAKIYSNTFNAVALDVTNTVAIDTTGGSYNSFRFNDMCFTASGAGQSARLTFVSTDLVGPNYWDTAANEYSIGTS